MPSLRQISTSRSAQVVNAPIAQTVMICQKPPSLSGAIARPRSSAGGLTLMSQGFQVTAPVMTLPSS